MEKLISRKINLTEKSSNFHTVVSKSTYTRNFHVIVELKSHFHRFASLNGIPNINARIRNTDQVIYAFINTSDAPYDITDEFNTHQGFVQGSGKSILKNGKKMIVLIRRKFQFR